MTRKDSSMSTTEPKAGEWWWVEHRFTSRPVPARWMEGGGWHCPSGWLAAEHAVPLARIPDPPAPEPTEAEKIDARRAEVIRYGVSNMADIECTEAQARTVASAIRRNDARHGYVLAPTSGEGFEAMVGAAVDVYWSRASSPSEAAMAEAIRAALEAAKGDAR